MKNLQTKINEMCANKIKVMSSISPYHPGDEQLCLNCTGYDKNCGHYKPYKNGCQIPINKGIVAYRLQNIETPK